MKIIHVRWIDAAIHSGWTRSHEEAGPLEVCTCGYLIYEDEDVVKIALNNSADTVFNGIESIPKSAIIKRRNLMG